MGRGKGYHQYLFVPKIEDVAEKKRLENGVALAMKVLMVFLDGFGLGEPDQRKNPYVTAQTPFLDEILGGHLLYRREGPLINLNAVMVPTETCLGIPGLPQSASGQTTLWTGVNAAARVGFHVNGYPTGTLIKILEEASIFKKLKSSGKRVAFANAYRPEYFEQVAQRRRRHSSSTVAALSAGLALRTLDDLRFGRAVYQDITNEMLSRLGYEVPVRSPAEAGTRLARLAAGYDFTLFEYFQTDIAGHRQDFFRARHLLTLLDTFLKEITANVDPFEFLILVVSDHGNVEDLSTDTHTVNPVPTLIIGREARKFSGSIKSLEDITPLIVEILSKD
ncbi:MAG: metalloenzyme [Bacillota bacterium]|nr:metalloenzyme [Bacillota bacterium]